MNLNQLWSIAALTAELCEVITYLTEDPHYTKEDAIQKLTEIIEMHIQPLHDKAINEVSK